MRSWVAVRLEGGLGNQMFQYAAARSLALATGRGILLDPSAIGRGVTPRRYELEPLDVAGEPVGPLVRTVIRGQLGLRIPPVVRGLIRAASRRRWTLVRDVGRGFDERLFTTAGDIVLEGAWQTAAYAERDPQVADQVRRDFRLRRGMPEGPSAVVREIGECESVCVHVRRGDYADDPRVAAIHGTLPLEYYSAAAGRIISRGVAPSFFVFSDDLSWARAAVRLPGRTRFVGEAAGMPPGVEQRLMASCRHFIIANSTFSWWAAWLATGPEKIVVTPRRWFAAAPAPEGLIPADWETA